MKNSSGGRSRQKSESNRISDFALLCIKCGIYCKRIERILLCSVVYS